jgi:hypothetical protein
MRRGNPTHAKARRVKRRKEMNENPLRLFFFVSLRETGLLRRFAPRNDDYANPNPCKITSITLIPINGINNPPKP